MLKPNKAATNFDSLTGVYARTFLGERLQGEVTRSSRYHLRFALFMLDLDHFKSVNDAFGHHRGDQVLAEVGRRLARAVRDVDEVYRYGGDEFVVLLPHTDPDQAAVVAERLLWEVGGALIPGEPPVSVSLSIGSAAFPEDAFTAEMLFEVADRRHYQAKQQGRGRFVSQDIDQPENHLLAVPSRLIERDDAIRTLGNFLDSLPAQKYGLLQIAGAPGMGRSRLLDEVQHAARLRGYGVFPFRATPALKSRWMGAVIEAQRSWESWPRLFTQKEALANALRDWLANKGRQGFVFTIDALEEFDRQSLDILAYLLRASQFPQFAAVYTGADGRALRPLWMDYPLKAAISLLPMTSAGVQVWLRHSLKWEAPPEFITWLHAQTGGKPARIQRGLTWLVEQKILQAQMDGWQIHPLYSETDLAQRLAPEQLAPTNLPAHLPTFIGREDEIGQLKRLIQEQRMVTVVGPGGIGKTSLVTQTAAESLPEFPNGVFFVPLAHGVTGDFILMAVAEALRFTFSGSQDARKQLLERLREQNMLLVLDNFEQLLEEAPLLSGILEGAPGLHILVTSRSPLNLPEETVLELGGLAYPVGSPDEEISTYSAIQLFLYTARKISPDFAPSADDSASLARICQLVEGMPLGLELAASAISFFTCQQIVTEVEGRLAFLSSERPDLPLRHRSMLAVFDSFWGLLSEVERSVLADLSVFRGGFSANAAQMIAGASPFFIESLVKMLFLHRLPRRRFTMHYLLNQYAAEKLRAQPEVDQQIRERHCDYFVSFVKTNGAQNHTSPTQEALDRIGAEIDNLRAAWEWMAARDDLSRMEQVLPSLKAFLDSRGWFREMLGLLYTAKGKLLQARQALGLEMQRDIFLVRVLTELGEYHYHLGSYPDGRQQLELAIDILAPLDRPAETASVIQKLANNVRSMGEYETAAALLRQGLIVAQETGDLTLESDLHNSLGVTLFLQGKHRAAFDVFEKCLEIARRLDDPWMLAKSLNNLGDIAFELQDYPRARSLSTESLAALTDENIPTLRVDILSSLARIAYTEGNFSEATQYLSQALGIVADIDATPLELALLLKAALMWERQGQNQRAFDLAQMILQHSTAHDILDQADQLAARLAEAGCSGSSASAGPANLRQITADVIAQLENTGPI